MTDKTVDFAGGRRPFVMIDKALIRSPHLSAGAKTVWALMVSYAWDDEACWAGQDLLAAEVPCNPKTLRGYLKELTDTGMLCIERRGLGKTNLYRLLEPALAALGEVPRPDRAESPAGTGEMPDQERAPDPATKTQGTETPTKETQSPVEAPARELFGGDRVSQVMEILDRVRRAPKAPAPKRGTVASLVEEFPAADHVEAARKLEVWAAGAQREVKNVASTYRRFLSDAPRASQNGGQRVGSDREAATSGGHQRLDEGWERPNFT